MFEIYQIEPNVSINYGLVLPETRLLTATCAAWGEWRPKDIPRCIRKGKWRDEKLDDFVLMLDMFLQRLLFNPVCLFLHTTLLIVAVNCTEPPLSVPGNDRGMFDWTIEEYNVLNDELLPRHYGVLIRYW